MRSRPQHVESLKAEGRLVDSEGRLYSHSSTPCMLFDLQS
jgi:hypothetical protein